jgi:hypothetical protein
MHGRTLQNRGIDLDDRLDVAAAGGPPRRRRRRWLIAAGIVLAVVVGGIIAAAILLRESTTPVDVEQAVGDFRAAEGTADDAAAALPAEGVYTYATSGRESIDALDGRHHDYPEVTTITVRHEGCGAVFDWRPLRERFDETVVCPEASGAVLPRYRSQHEFFGTTDHREFVCEPGSLWYPSSTEPGTTWTLRCATEDIEVVRTGTITGLSEVDVGGAAVEVLAFELRDEISGASTGTTERVVKVVPGTGLIVELSMAVDVQNDSPIGDVHYLELYRLQLTSLTPRR